MNTIDEFKYNLLMNIEVLENNFKQMGKKEQLTKMSGHKDRRLNTISGILLQYLIC